MTIVQKSTITDITAEQQYTVLEQYKNAKSEKRTAREDKAVIAPSFPQMPRATETAATIIQSAANVLFPSMQFRYITSVFLIFVASGF